MTSFSRSATDTAGGTDAASRLGTKVRTSADAAGGTDSVFGGIRAPATGFTLPLITITIDPLAVVLAIPTTPKATPVGQQTKYAVIAVDIHGKRFAEYPTAQVTSIVEELNAAGSAQFSIPIDDPNIAQLPIPNASLTPHHEVQIWRNGHLYWWGVPIKRQVNGKDRRYEYTAVGLMWYFTRRYVGDAERFNNILNPGAELGTANWLAVNSTFTASTDRAILGTHSFRVAAVGNSNDAYIYQRKLIHAGSIGLALFLAAWAYLPSSTGFIPNTHSYGAVLLRKDPTTDTTLQLNATPGVINFTTAKDTWVRQETVVNIPPNTTNIVETRLYAPAANTPNGYIYWDAIQLVVMEALAFAAVPNHPSPDQVNIAKGLISYAQGKGKGIGNGKSDLNISTAGADSGVVADRVYQLAAHQRIYTGSSGGSGCIDEWPSNPTGFDFDIEVFPQGVRTFTTYYPQKGTTKNDLALVYGRNVSDYTLSEDISTSANQVVVLGNSDTNFDEGAAREEGGYNNPSSLGGLTLELVHAAPTDAPIGQLANLAAMLGGQLETPVQIPSLTVFEPRDPATGAVLVPLIGFLRVGDIVPVVLQDADVDLNADYRIVQITLDTQAETMNLVLNPAEIGRGQDVQGGL